MRLRHLLAAALLLTSLPVSALSQRGAGVFRTAFNHRATDYDRENAYLMSYLANVIYVEHLMTLETGRFPKAAKGEKDEDEYIRLNSNPQEFETRLIKAVKVLFQRADGSDGAQFKFIHEGNETGYDPEAMAIAADDALYVAFRGTDRVGQNDAKSSSAFERFGYDWSEWLASDFDLIGISPGMGIAGKVHRGFWQSLTYDPKGRRGGGDRAFHLQVRDFLDANDPQKTKPLWITGHSLGAAHAQLFAAYITAAGRRPQGVYALAAPHAGDQAFVNWLNSNVGKKRIQRIDFIDDPITMVPPYISGYARAGTRVYHNDIQSTQLEAPERSILNAFAILSAINGIVVGGAATAMVDAIGKATPIKLRLNYLKPDSEFGYHHPTWYLGAAYERLSGAGKLRVPAPLPLPDANSEACSRRLVARAMKATETRIADAIQDTADTISYNADQLLKNTTGDAISPGSYRFRCMEGGRYLDLRESRDGKEGAAPELYKEPGAPGNNVFKVEKNFGVGYKISRKGKNLEVDLKEILSDGGRVQMWGGNIMPNQVWLFYKTSKPKHFLLVNLNSMKALKGTASGVGKNGGEVQQSRARNNDKTMVWICEKL